MLAGSRRSRSGRGDGSSDGHGGELQKMGRELIRRPEQRSGRCVGEERLQAGAVALAQFEQDLSDRGGSAADLLGDGVDPQGAVVQPLERQPAAVSASVRRPGRGRGPSCRYRPAVPPASRSRRSGRRRSRPPCRRSLGPHPTGGWTGSGAAARGEVLQRAGSPRRCTTCWLTRCPGARRRAGGEPGRRPGEGGEFGRADPRDCPAGDGGSARGARRALDRRQHRRRGLGAGAAGNREKGNRSRAAERGGWGQQHTTGFGSASQGGGR